MTLLQIHNTKSNNLYQIMRLKAYYEIHNSFDHSLNATYAKLSRKWNEVTECIGVQVSQLIDRNPCEKCLKRLDPTKTLM